MPPLPPVMIAKPLLLRRAERSSHSSYKVFGSASRADPKKETAFAKFAMKRKPVKNSQNIWNDVTNERVYASKRGKRYYPWWCDAGRKSIKEGNIVWFGSPAVAELEGYTIAKSCE